MLNIAELWGSPWETLCLHYSELLRDIMLSNCVFRISKSYERPCALTIVCGTKDEPRRRTHKHIYIERERERSRHEPIEVRGGCFFLVRPWSRIQL